MHVRIAFLSVSAAFGGSESVLWQLVRGMRRLARAPDCTAIVPREGVLAQRLREIGAAVRVLPMPAGLASFGEWSLRGASAAKKGAAMLSAAAWTGPYQRALQSLLTEIDPDVIHTNGFKLHVLGSRAAPRGSAVVWHLHDYLSNRPLSRRLLRHHVSRTAAVVANSRSVAEDAQSVLGGAAHVTAVYNAVDLVEFSSSGPAADLDALSGLTPAAAGAVRVGLVATFARWKGHETFLRALALVRTTPIRAYIVGGAVYDTAASQYTIDELRAMAQSLGVAGRVGFTGFVDRPAEAMRALDIVVHASTDPEPFGLVVAEGLAAGRAVIVSAAGGAAELVQPDVDALTCTPGDVPALARSIDRLAGDAPLRARLGTAARATAERRFDADLFTHAFLDVYERVAPRSGPVAT